MVGQAAMAATGLPVELEARVDMAAAQVRAPLSARNPAMVETAAMAAPEAREAMRVPAVPQA
jgi:hypothetical protein